ncbi:MAG: Ureidoglycolate lyase [Cirrosporium novae-zelandiae]|nr:MAG: Ureidoglycolate lyase [Cirrosporium novae-zelandiae]
MHHISALSIDIDIEPLTPEAFSPFGYVIENPRNASQAVTANQGTALKYLDVSRVINNYKLAPSSKPEKAVMTMFVCSPRKLESRTVLRRKSTTTLRSEMVFPVPILERHPFTTQTFIPIGVSSKDEETRYLVIVAPNTASAVKTASGRSTPNQPPDLPQLKAFIAHGGQAVTYGAGVWHAPMAVIGKGPIDFVVVQFANGVGLEDCEEVELGPVTDKRGVCVQFPRALDGVLLKRSDISRL